MRFKFFATFIILLTFFILISSCTKNLPKLQVVYQNSFDGYNLDSIQISGFTNGANNFGPVNDIRITDFNGSKVLGTLNSNLMDLKLHNLTIHDAISVEFDLYIHDQWKNDLWKYTFDGVDQLVTGFSNDSTVKQSYPNWIGNGSALNPPGSDSYSKFYGACSLKTSPKGTTLYKMVRTIFHTGNTFQLDCSDAGNFFNLPCQRSWSIDNLKITLIKY